MNFAQSHYCKLNRVLARWVGLWPYETATSVPILRVACVILLSSGAVVQLMSFVTMEYSLELLWKILSYTIIKIIYVIKYTFFMINGDKVRELFKAIESDWATLSDEEVNIMKEYATNAQLMMKICTNAIDFVGSIVLLGTEMTFLFLISHSCAMFTLASKRIEWAVERCVGIADDCEKRIGIQNAILHAARAHWRAFEYSESLRSCFHFSYFVLMTLGVASLAINLFRFSQTILAMDEMEEVIMSLLFIIAHVAYMFLINYLGQELMDHSSDIFYRTYDTQWHRVPLLMRKLLMFIMQRSMRTYSFSSCGVYNASYEGFSTIISTALSYFTLICSTQR
ncbi:hypothetical protein KM043_002457 [Ampulex compressa]|nr:hypothetical protein KM043_002457 [Ampulex compressa]